MTLQAVALALTKLLAARQRLDGTMPSKAHLDTATYSAHHFFQAHDNSSNNSQEDDAVMYSSPSGPMTTMSGIDPVKKGLVSAQLGQFQLDSDSRIFGSKLEFNMTTVGIVSSSSID
eukprot:scaffold3008_cov112-Skeletonema_menzelii.AAC.8